MLRRTPNFTVKDETRLMRLVKRHSAIIDCKKTDTTANLLKKKTWHALCEEFNLGADHYRSPIHLHNKYNNIKKREKKLRLRYGNAADTTANENTLDTTIENGNSDTSAHENQDLIFPISGGAGGGDGPSPVPLIGKIETSEVELNTIDMVDMQPAGFDSRFDSDSLSRYQEEEDEDEEDEDPIIEGEIETQLTNFEKEKVDLELEHMKEKNQIETDIMLLKKEEQRQRLRHNQEKHELEMKNIKEKHQMEMAILRGKK